MLRNMCLYPYVVTVLARPGALATEASTDRKLDFGRAACPGCSYDQSLLAARIKSLYAFAPNTSPRALVAAIPT
jgi:hypothetical protein